MTPRAWKIALITGLLGFVIAAAMITLPERCSASRWAGAPR